MLWEPEKQRDIQLHTKIQQEDKKKKGREKDSGMGKAVLLSVDETTLWALVWVTDERTESQKGERLEESCVKKKPCKRDRKTQIKK